MQCSHFCSKFVTQSEDTIRRCIPISSMTRTMAAIHSCHEQIHQCQVHLIIREACCHIPMPSIKPDNSISKGADQNVSQSCANWLVYWLHAISHWGSRPWTNELDLDLWHSSKWSLLVVVFQPQYASTNDMTPSWCDRAKMSYTEISQMMRQARFASETKAFCHRPCILGQDT